MRIPTVAAAILALALVAVPTAAAHKTAYTSDGKVKIVWGFLNEPAVTMTKTGLDLILTDNATGAPITGAETTLQAELHIGDEEKELTGFKPQFGKPGAYTDVITLTQPGLYVLHLSGTLNGTAIDVAVPAAHEVEAIEETYFPETNATDHQDLAQKVSDLEARVAALEAKLKTQAETPSPVTKETGGKDAPGFTLLAALGAVGVVLLFRRRA